MRGPHNLKKLPNGFWRLLTWHQNQVGDLFKFWLPFQKTWTLKLSLWLSNSWIQAVSYFMSTLISHKDYKVRFPNISVQGVHWNLFDLTPYKGLCVVVHLFNGHLPKEFFVLKNNYLVYHEVFKPLKITILLMKISHFSTNLLFSHVTLLTKKI